MTYHAKLVSPQGRIYHCDHEHRTQTAAITCANTSGTRRMAEMTWRREATQQAQAAERVRRREADRAAEVARRAAAKAAAEKAEAARKAAAIEAAAAKRAAKLAAMRPERAWKRMTPEERLLKTAESELAVYGAIVSDEARAEYKAKHGPVA